MKILVTGANGFLGSWVTRALVNEGHHVYALVRPKSDISELSGVNCKYVHGDVTDVHSLLEAFKGVDTVFHLAGVIAYKKSERALMDKVNVQGTANVVSVCREHKVRRLVYLSSVVAIGAGYTPQDVMNEDSPYNISDLNLGYFETKHEAEILVKKACDKGEIDAVILNPSTIYGAGDAKKGSRKMQVKVAQGKFKFYTSGGVNVVAVEDVVQGILSAWKKGRKGERYILAGENILIKDLFAMIAAEAGVKAPSHQLPDSFLHLLGATGDLMDKMGLKGPISRENAYTSTMYHWFDSSKAQRELDFKPRPAREAIHNSVQWMKDHHLLS
ncbi:NAD-dependent epimerase/dehydratase family protein [Bdellovibrio sp. 22V]|uniref:NAD-dependent epimerase/dehydratase family protein n=1 Tax=Bdellovibrio TaxID=958 RepID=UPI002543D69C|nr:NAD-dependent epimerase/dehydratase family protein [Bdellovibrio sp. 22V]WII70568.1 NAD-dependent epimerase/dehydratase family protein [Bdellovibrio sp. 22V]